MKKNNRGIGLIEMVIAITVSLIVFAVIIQLLPFIINFARPVTNRATIQGEALASMDTMLTMLSGARAQSAVVSTPPTVGQPLWSSISFQRIVNDGHATMQKYQLFQSGNTLKMTRIGTFSQVATLAQHVAQVSFTFPTGEIDPYLLTVSLRMQTEGSSGHPIFLQRSVRLDPNLNLQRS